MEEIDGATKKLEEERKRVLGTVNNIIWYNLYDIIYFRKFVPKSRLNGAQD